MRTLVQICLSHRQSIIAPPGTGHGPLIQASGPFWGPSRAPLEWIYEQHAKPPRNHALDALLNSLTPGQRDTLLRLDNLFNIDRIDTSLCSPSDMRALVVLAQPEPTSLSASLSNEVTTQLQADGYEVRTSNLYEMGWKATVDRTDFPDLAPNGPLRVVHNSRDGYQSGSLTQDVLTEQEKLDWADTLIIVFPLWWFSEPAILKGWIERVFSAGYGYLVGEHNSTRWGSRYGEGTFSGKRAMLVVTIGGWREHYSATGINGSIDHLLFRLNHGFLFYGGFNVLPPFLVFKADRMDKVTFDETAGRLRQRVSQIATAAPIPYRRQNFGDYHIPGMQLKEELIDNGVQGFDLHVETKKRED